ncbi:type VI secretion system lipoprotein IglE [Cysteiniphilum sp. QT6929]|uniref:type VI secretion system lipoprotein IglE n=1 Tax=Cysteiniphilum sp. QT6929 TaxID=2975055 RepID=UPI0024B342EB|nr:type VI secretion system lipoprotein IglE [Cysteiniphilum sp. QT6929]WHN66603.1 hypothetical protein NYP54_05095 [Cysteiniphilum sp. QT6929]
MAKMMKYITIAAVFLMLSGCSLIPWYHSTTMTVKVDMSKDANDKQPITMLISQPADQKNFVTADYATISQSALDQGVTRYVFMPDQGAQKISLDVSDTPVAIYFILKHQPVSGWKYYIEKPQGESVSFTINQFSVKKDS